MISKLATGWRNLSELIGKAELGKTAKLHLCTTGFESSFKYNCDCCDQLSSVVRGIFPPFSHKKDKKTTLPLAGLLNQAWILHWQVEGPSTVLNFRLGHTCPGMGLGTFS